MKNVMIERKKMFPVELQKLNKNFRKNQTTIGPN